MTKIGATIILVVILVSSAFIGLYGNAQGWFAIPSGTGGSGGTGGTGGTGGSGGTGGAQQGTVNPSTWSGPLYASITDKVTGAAFTTATISIDQIGAVNGVFNFISGPSKSLTQAANPQSEVRIWNQGDEIIVMGDCTGDPTNGLDYYPAMYWMKLYQGAPIYELTSYAAFVQVSTNPYTYSINTQYATKLSQTISQYEASNIKYWNIGDLGLYPRQNATDFDMYLTHGGTTLASVTDASTWVDTAAEITANSTLTSTTNDKLEFKMVGANSNVGWGKEFYVISSIGKVQRYGAVIVMTTAMTAIGNDALTGKGWIPMTTSQLYAEKGFYKELAPVFPSKGQKAGWSVEIPIDCASATASTAYKISVWVNDAQNLENVAALGTSTSVPTAYGFVTSYGLGAVLHATAVTFSSGAGATMQLEAYLTTPS
jgi:hypothetical protein